MTEEQLKRFIPRDTDDETAGRLQWHIEHCPKCQSIIDKKEKLNHK